MRRALVPAALLTTLSFAFAPAAGAKIVIGESIGGVAIGDSRADAEAIAGKGTNKQTGEAGYSLDYRSGTFTINYLIKGNTVFGMTSTSRFQRTANGIGPGVSAATMMRRLSGEHCLQVEIDGIQRGQCALTSKDGTETDFDYSLKTRRVVDVSLVNYG